MLKHSYKEPHYRVQSDSSCYIWDNRTEVVVLSGGDQGKEDKTFESFFSQGSSYYAILFPVAVIDSHI